MDKPIVKLYEHRISSSDDVIEKLNDDDYKNNQKILSSGKGFIQIISPIPHSYPGISILTDDIGEIIGQDDCTCGRLGKRFVFSSRSEVADPKGCGDTLEI